MLFGAPLSPSAHLLCARRLLRQKALPALLAALVAVGLVACQPEEGGGQEDNPSAPPVVDVTMVDYAFQAPDSIPSGWTTLRVRNEGKEHHNMHLHRLPDGRTAADYRQAFRSPMDSLTNLLRNGEISSAEFRNAYNRVVPAWARLENLHSRAGMGFLAPGRSARTTVKLDPGIYVMDCTIRAPSGAVHGSLGMRSSLTVTEEQTGADPPSADITARVAGRELRVPDTLSPGTHTVAFEVETVAAGVDSAYYVTLARLKPGTSIDSVMQWTYRNPAPTDFLGGFEYIDVGRTSYVTVDLSPGRYLWHWDYIMEEEPSMHKEFVVE